MKELLTITGFLHQEPGKTARWIMVLILLSGSLADTMVLFHDSQKNPVQWKNPGAGLR